MGGPVHQLRKDCTRIAVLTRSGQNRRELGVRFKPVSIASGSHPSAPNRPEIELVTISAVQPYIRNTSIPIPVQSQTEHWLKDNRN